MKRITQCLCCLLAVGALLMVIKTVAADRGLQEPLRVSIVTLIASPRQYNDMRVYVNGYLDLANESDAVYFHEVDYRYGMTKNAIKLVLENSQRVEYKALSRKYVLLEGTFEADKVEGGRFSGHIVNVTRISELLTEDEFLRRQRNPSSP